MADDVITGAAIDPEVAEAAARFHIFDQEMDPHALTAALREQCPVARSEMVGGHWVLTRHEDMERVLQDPATFSSAQGNSVPPAFDPIGTWIPLHFDPPEHNRYRRDINSYFLPKKMAAREDELRRLAVCYLEPIVADGGGDLVERLCVPYPSEAFLLMLGAPVADAERLLYWKNMNMLGMSGDPAAEKFVNEQIRPEYLAYFDALLEERANSENPPDDILTGLTKAKVGDRPYSRGEMLRVCTTMMIAGLDTVTAALGWALHFLATSPEYRQQLINDPSLIPTAVEELNRYFSTVSVARRATRDTELGGTAIAKDDWVLCVLPAAGRDGGTFPDADRVDFTRTPNRHLAFGSGPHHCLGVHLARIEMRVLLEEMMRLMPHHRIAPGAQARFYNGIVLGVATLPIEITGLDGSDASGRGSGGQGVTEDGQSAGRGREAGRAEIIVAARHEFGRRGLASARIRDISAAIGTTDAKIYRLFTSKQALFDYVLADSLQTLVDRIREMAGEFPRASRDTRYLLAQRTQEQVLALFSELAPLLGVALFHDSEAGRRFYRESLWPTLAECAEALGGVMADQRGQRIDPRHLILAMVGMHLAAATAQAQNLDDPAQAEYPVSDAITEALAYGLEALLAG